MWPFKEKIEEKGAMNSGMSQSGSASDHLLGRMLAGLMSGTSITGEAINPQTAMRFSAVWACITLLSDSVASMPIDIMTEQNGRMTVDRDHALNKVLRGKPNAFMSPSDFKTSIMAQILTTGAFIAKPEFIGGEVVAINTRLSETHHFSARDNRLFVSYGGKDVSADDLLIIRGFTLDGITPCSPIEFNRDAISLGKVTQRHGANYFKNGALPGLKVTAPKALSPEQRDKLEKRYEEKYAGEDNAFKLMLLEAGFTAEPFQIKNSDAQFIESQKLSVAEVSRIFRVPPHMIGDLERSTNNNIEHQSLDFVRYSLNPHLKRIEEGLQVALLPRSEWGRTRIKFNVESLLRGDLDSRSNYYTLMVTGGILTPNEARDKEDLPPLAGGDKLLAQQQMMPLSDREGK